MAIEFDTTIGGTASTSYVDIANASQYFENSDDTKFSNWGSLSSDNQMRALNSATLYIDSNYSWSTGIIASTDQTLAWPRSSAEDSEGRDLSGVIPPQVLAACCELVMYQYSFDTDCPSRIDLTPEIGPELKSEELEGVGKIERFANSSQIERTYPLVDDLLSSLTSLSGNSFLIQVRRG